MTQKCLTCGYDISSLPLVQIGADVCPECGKSAIVMVAMTRHQVLGIAAVGAVFGCMPAGAWSVLADPEGRMMVLSATSFIPGMLVAFMATELLLMGMKGRIGVPIERSRRACLYVSCLTSFVGSLAISLPFAIDAALSTRWFC